MRKWIGPDQAHPVQDCQSVDRSSPTFPLDRTGLSPTADRDRLDWWNHCIEECDQAVMDFLSATDVGKFPPKWTTVWRRRRGGLRCGEAAMRGYSRFFCAFPFLFFPMSLLVFGLVFAFVLSLIFYIYQRGWRVAGGELRHLAGSPGGGGGFLGPVIL